MHEDIETYLEKLKAGEPVRNRVTALLSAFAILNSETVTRIFLSESLSGHASETGARWESLWGFSENFWFQARGFYSIDEFDVDVSPLTGAVSYLGVSSKGFTYENSQAAGVSDSSTMSLEVETGTSHLYNPLAATGVNCAELCSIVIDILSPNLRIPIGSP